MMAAGKPKQVVVTAVARELAGFVWAIACITSDPPAVATETEDAGDCATPELARDVAVAEHDAAAGLRRLAPCSPPSSTLRAGSAGGRSLPLRRRGAMLDRGCARRLQDLRPGRRNGACQPENEPASREGCGVLMNE